MKSDELRLAVIQDLTSGTAISDIATKHEIAKSTIYHWLSNDIEFSRNYNLAMRRLHASNLKTACLEVSNCIQVFVDIRDDESIKPAIRLKAAQCLIEYSTEASQMNAQLELDALKRDLGYE